ncbi:GSCFA domain-containing protein [Novosphingobium sp. P6W]|uniref:GSCFA domain-containing protein n=1 Tax=Novosphingobium sp. P6W TaxID=1609758 RepID=UPI000696E3AB|nr:GSCFA domain-containing protein [Novosphingobium sp. P6W]AXB80670.1 hypothetical protein TQ38_029350 [Novosphingobium sp. P6W]
MPIQSFSSREAGRNMRANPLSLWPGGRRSGHRLEQIAEIAGMPSFQFSMEDKIMTIGSCFAREIEKALAAKGFELPAMALQLTAEERGGGTANEILNKYTVHSMANEIEWAFEPPAVRPEDLFVTAGEGLWHDPHLVANMSPVTMEYATERREKVYSIMRRLPECRVVVVTLGLAEAWYDTKIDAYLNVMPPQAALNAEPDRFRLDVLSYQDITDGVERLLALVRKYGHPEHKVLLTVSPVPFKATMTGRDALAANTYSKSVQRAAAEAAVLRHDNVDYFPSYEIVTLTDRKIAYRVDNIHVNPEVVGEIMRRAIRTYLPDEAVKEEQPVTAAVAQDPSRDPFTTTSILAAAHAALDADDYATAASHFSALLYRAGDSIRRAEMRDCYKGLLRALLGGNRLKEARRVCEEWLSKDPENGAAAAMASKIMERDKKPEAALEFAARAVELQPENGIYHQRLAILLDRSGEKEQARASAREALRFMPDLDGARKLLEA